MTADPKVLIVAENASARMGGEAILPLHYFRFLWRRGVDVRLLVHERSRAELEGTLAPEALERVHFVPETRFQTLAWQIGRRLPQRVAEVSFYWWVHASTGLRQRRAARELVAERGIEVVHQPTPVSPKQPSFLHDLGAPVIVGPMNGGMTFPPAFSTVPSFSERLAVRLGRGFSSFANRVFPGKREAAALLVANQRSRDALPAGVTGKAIELVENGVDLSLWEPAPASIAREVDRPPTFTFLGFLKDWKGVDLLLRATALALEREPLRLQVIGDGPERPALENLAGELAIAESVTFVGFVPQPECPPLLARSRALVLPSLYECGGAVVLEAMAAGIPAIATRWGGPASYLTDECGILVEPSSRERFARDLSDALVLLARDENLAAEMGRKGRQRVEKFFSWDAKIERILEIYRATSQAHFSKD